MLFKEVIGQEKIKDLLIRTVKDNHISHAQLFLGADGCGNLALALAYAQYISCTRKTDVDACGECPSCLKYQKLIHPDLHFVFPVVNSAKDSKTKCDDLIEQWREAVIDNPYLSPIQWYEKLGVENKQGVIPAHESLEIIRKINLKTYESDYKIMIIWKPETMNNTTANKLLKILEEPPVNTVFLLVTASTDELLPTILSRTQLLRIPRIDKKSMSITFQQKFNLEGPNLDSLLQAANGDYNRALELIKNREENIQNHDQFRRYMQLCYTLGKEERRVELVQWIDQIATLGRERQKNFIQYGLGIIREAFVAGFKNQQLNYMADFEADFVTRFSPFIRADNAPAIAEELNKAYQQIEMNAYAKLVFMDMAFKIARLVNMKK
jgi:DNA polymerase III subunit delta'